MMIGREGYPKYPAILFILIQIDDKGFFARPFSFIKRMASQLEAETIGVGSTKRFNCIWERSICALFFSFPIIFIARYFIQITNFLQYFLANLLLKYLKFN